MALIAAKCSQCGADLQIESGRDFYFCTYCGTKMIMEKQHIELSGNVTINGSIASEDSLLERAFIFIKDGYFSRADEYLENVLDANPRNAKAYIGKLLCLLKLNDENLLADNATILTEYPFFNKAIEFAEDDYKNILLGYNQKVLDKESEYQDRVANSIELLSKEISAKEKYVKENKAKYTAATLAYMFFVLGAIVVAIRFIMLFFLVSTRQYQGNIWFSPDMIELIIFGALGIICAAIIKWLTDYINGLNEVEEEVTRMYKNRDVLLDEIAEKREEE